MARVLALRMRVPLGPSHPGPALYASKCYIVCYVREHADAERTHAASARDVSRGGCRKCENSRFHRPGEYWAYQHSWLLALLDDLVLVLVVGTQAAQSRAASRVSVLGHPRFVMRSTESNEIVRNKLTVVALREIVLLLPIVSAVLGVTGPTGLSSVLPPL